MVEAAPHPTQGHEHPPGRRMRVVLATEGTYPHFTGGVSTWCEHLIRGNPDVDFTVWALMMNPFIAPRFPFPDNVKRFVGLPLWGTEQPVEFTPQVGASKAFALGPRTTEARVRERFSPLLRRLLLEMSAPTFDPIRFGELLHEVHLYFREHDYRSTFRSRAVWETFKTALLETNGGTSADAEDQDAEAPFTPEAAPTRSEARSIRELFRRQPTPPPPERTGLRQEPTIEDAIEGMRWMYRLLLPLDVPIVDADLVHTSAAAFCGIPGILAKIEHGTPFLVTEHGVYMREQYLAVGRYGFSYHLKRFVVQLIAAISRTCFAYADQISPVCQFNARWELRNGADPERVRVVYNGVDPVVFSPQVTERSQAPTVVTLARMDPLKDLETFVRVAAHVREQIPDVQFLHWGPDADEDYAREVRRLTRELGLEQTVRFMGPTADPARAWNHGDVALLTSMSEAFPYAVIEALMCGVPVVATDVGGVSEALDGAGALARAGDAEALADEVVRFLSLDPGSHAELSEECRARALNRFTLESAVRQYRDTYHSLTQSATLHEPPTPAPERGVGTRRTIPVELDLDAEAEAGGEPETGAGEPGPPEQVEPGTTAEADAAAAGAADARTAVEVERTTRGSGERHERAAPSLRGDSSARRAALEDAYTRHDESLARAVRALRDDPDPEIRRRVLVAAVSAPIPRDERTRMLSEALAGDPDPSVRSAAASGLTTLLGEQR